MTSTSAREPLLVLRAEAQARLADIAVHHFDVILQKFGEFVAVAFGELFEHRRFFDYALKALQGGVGAVVANEQIDAADFGQVREQIREPNFADEAGGADRAEYFFRAARRGRKKPCGRCAIRSGPQARTLWARRVRLDGSLRRGRRDFSRSRESLINFSRETRPSGWLPVNRANGAARTNYGIEQASCGHALAKIEAIGNDARDAEMFCKRTHDVIEALANQHNFAARGDRFVQLGDARVASSAASENIRRIPRRAGLGGRG